MLPAESRSTRSTGGRATGDAGFTLIEVFIAMMLITIMALGVAQLFGLAIRSTQAARYQTSTTILASQKLEQLRALTWGFDATGIGLPVSDTTTDLTVEPPSNSGNGLNPSPVNTLDVNTVGYVDYLDARGQWVGNSAAPPATALYIRRWNITPLPTNPNNTLILQVLVTTVHRERTAVAMPRVRLADDALVTTIKTRKAR
jgi:prepilin-type N-terminal cleavage/methylation domain-containing protein